MSKAGPAPRITAIGIVSWDEFFLLDRLPVNGGSANIQATLSAPGGTTGNIAMTVRRLGATVDLFARIGSDERGHALFDSLRQAGVGLDGIIPDPSAADLSVMLVSGISGERTILWQQAPTITRGDRIDIGLLFAADLTIVDCVEMDLRRFLTDLPAHTQPGARLLGTLTYLAEVVAHDKLEVALRHDILVGNEREYCALAGDDDPMRALERIAAAMPGSNLRVAVMTQGRRGSVAVSRAGRWCASARSVTVRDTTGAGDAFAGAFAYAQARRWEIEHSLAFANATASFVVGAIGAQTSLPSLEQVLATLDGDTR